MAWTNPKDWNVGELITKVIMDTHIRDNLNYLKTAVDEALSVIGRQGGSATDWNSSGTNNYTPTGGKIQVGAGTLNATTDQTTFFVGAVAITFPVAFSQTPVVFVTSSKNADGAISFGVTSITTSGATITGRVFDSSTTGLTFSWLAIGE